MSWRKWLADNPLRGLIKRRFVPKSEGRDLTAERDAVCLPIARALLKKLGEKDNLLIGVASEQEFLDYYNELYLEAVVPLILNNDVKISYIKYIFQLMAQAVQQLEERTVMTLNYNLDLVIDTLLGSEQMETPILELHTMMKEINQINNEHKAKE